METEDIIAEVQSVIQDGEWTDANVLSIINRGLVTIAAGVLLPDRYQVTPPLPDLYAVDTVDTVVGSGICDLPMDYQREVVQVLNENYESIIIVPSFRRFLQDHPQQNVGSVYVCAAHGKRLLYRDIPETAETLTIHYYARPTDLAAADEPDSLPESLQLPLLQSYACQYIFNQIEDGIEGQKINTQYWKEAYIRALMDLEIELGFDAEPDYYENAWKRID